MKKENKSGNFEVVKNPLKSILEKNVISISKQLTDVTGSGTMTLIFRYRNKKETKWTRYKGATKLYRYAY